jgi:ketosteroid isomerase-like protein
MFALVALTMISFAPDTALDIANAERAFSKRFSEIGFRDSFLEFFADEAISFEPEPGLAKPRLQPRPSGPEKDNNLVWEPIFAGINSSRDMGFTTGPLWGVSVADGKRDPNFNGTYFSVWTKKPEGWKVLIDLGVGSQKVEGQLKLLEPDAVEPTKVDKQTILDLDKKATTIGKPHGESIAAHAEENAVVVLYGVGPLNGKAEITSKFTLPTTKWEPIDATVSPAGDFAFIYGKFGFGGEKPREGHYVRVWRRGKNGWKILAQTAQPLPPKR